MDLLRNLVALVLVAGVPAALVLGAAGAWQWSRWMVRAGAVGVGGLVLTAMATANAAVPRVCDEARGIRNRPVLAAVVEGASCRRTGLAQVELPVLVGLASSVLVVARRRPADSAAC